MTLPPLTDAMSTMTEPRFFTLREELSRAPEDGGRWGAFWDVGVSKQTKADDLRALRDTHACLCDCAVKAAAPTNWDSNVSAIGETVQSMTQSELPPSESLSRWVSFELR